mmetsp:Transcript_2001/g.4589  ORF Transcript_2001/g.4589 Transcript_2001/m.4589 type:complete len:86 (+) Transcript_2001:2-259(+)
MLMAYLTKGMLCGEDVVWAALAKATAGFTGAELEALCREAYMNASAAAEDDRVEITQADFEEALAGMTPMLTKEDIDTYSAFRGN